MNISFPKHTQEHGWIRVPVGNELWWVAPTALTLRIRNKVYVTIRNETLHICSVLANGSALNPPPFTDFTCGVIDGRRNHIGEMYPLAGSWPSLFQFYTQCRCQNEFYDCSVSTITRHCFPNHGTGYRVKFCRSYMKLTAQHSHYTTIYAHVYKWH